VAGATQRVVILYAHPLLGEGLARLLGADSRLSVEAVHAEDAESARAALGDAPDVVIVERTAFVRAVDLLALASGALVIDVGLDAGSTWAYHCDELPGQPDALLRTIREAGRRAPQPGGRGGPARPPRAPVPS
jgi:DNA-binding NarL/FixJ family response regulator